MQAMYWNYNNEKITNQLIYTIMIFVTTGTQIPFDRFIQAIDEIAVQINETIIVQAFKSKYQPKHVQTFNFLEPNEFKKFIDEARLIISHAGMGSILSALEHEKPIIIFPRLASWGEHRNDHQMATAMKMNELGYVYVAYDKIQLKELILNKDLKPLKVIDKKVSDALINSIIN
jgi:UDP-N-acetylglucosamine transferase subunit ALG13